MKKSDFRRFLKKFWFVVWKDDSFRGWIISLIFLFLVIKFVFFPLLSLITGTSLPLAIVESCSMYHEKNVFSKFDLWYDRHEIKYSSLGISKEDFRDFKMKRGFSKGDILFIVGVKPENIEVGDVILFNGNQKRPIIHRVIEIKEDSGKFIFSTIGDNNNGQLSVEEEILESQIIGKASVRLAPYLGWIKLVFFEPLRPASDRGFCSENSPQDF